MLVGERTGTGDRLAVGWERLGGRERGVTPPWVSRFCECGRERWSFLRCEGRARTQLQDDLCWVPEKQKTSKRMT